MEIPGRPIILQSLSRSHSFETQQVVRVRYQKHGIPTLIFGFAFDVVFFAGFGSKSFGRCCKTSGRRQTVFAHSLNYHRVDNISHIAVIVLVRSVDAVGPEMQVVSFDIRLGISSHQLQNPVGPSALINTIFQYQPGPAGMCSDTHSMSHFVQSSTHLLITGVGPETNPAAVAGICRLHP